MRSRTGDRNRTGGHHEASLFDAVCARALVGTEDGGRTLLLRADQVLLQDATGTLVMQGLDALGPARPVAVEAVQYVDHNLMQADFRNADDHRYLREGCAARGIEFSPPGNGISHPLHMELRGRPGTVLVGSDSHSCAAGALGALGIGLGSLSVAAILSGEPLRLGRPRILRVRLDGRLTHGVSAKDVVLDVLRRLGTSGGRGAVLEYSGSGLATLSVWDRHVIANMGAETGALTSIFPSDEATRTFLRAVGREDAWVPIAADGGEPDIAIDLTSLGPLVARPGSPADVVPVEEVEGVEVSQAYLGSSANPSHRDFAAAAAVLEGRAIAPGVSLEINPTTRSVLADMTASGVLAVLIGAGGRTHQTGCNGCNGMGQAPGTGTASIRTVPRNFPGRSGTVDDRVYLASPETVAASALAGRIADPRRAPRDAVQIRPAPAIPRAAAPHVKRLDPIPEAARFRGPGIKPLPTLSAFDPIVDVPFVLGLGDDVSTDAISPAGAAALPYRSDIAKLAEFSFRDLAPSYVADACAAPEGHAIRAGGNYGQGSSREHAALCPRHLGLRVVVAPSIARIHRQNLIAAGVVPLACPPDLAPAERIAFDWRDLADGALSVRLMRDGAWVDETLACALDEWERRVLEAGGIVRHLRREEARAA